MQQNSSKQNIPNKLTPKQESDFESLTTMMLWKAPGFRHIWYKLLATTHSAGGSKHVAVIDNSGATPIASTDGKNITLNANKFFEEFTLPEQTFIAAHEIVHNVYGDVELLHRCLSTGKVPMHNGSSVPFDNDTMQRAMDARINAILIEGRIGKPPKIGHFDKEVDGKQSVLDIYKRYYDEKFGDSEQEPNGGQGNNPGGFDTLAPPGESTGQDPNSAVQQRSDDQWAVAVATARTLEQDRNQGKLAAGLERLFKEILEPVVPWVDHIETLINRSVGDGSYNWHIPDPWMAVHEFFSPSPTGRGAGRIMIWGDTSGSRSDREIAENVAELAGIMESVNPERLTVVWGDAAVNEVEEINESTDLTTLKPKGGGGTDMHPFLDWVGEQHPDTPDLIIAFTDGYLTFPKEGLLPCPIIWAMSTDVQPPYGQVVRITDQKRGV